MRHEEKRAPTKQETLARRSEALLIEIVRKHGFDINHAQVAVNLAIKLAEALGETDA